MIWNDNLPIGLYAGGREDCLESKNLQPLETDWMGTDRALEDIINLWCFAIVFCQNFGIEIVIKYRLYFSIGTSFHPNKQSKHVIIRVVKIVI